MYIKKIILQERGETVAVGKAALIEIRRSPSICRVYLEEPTALACQCLPACLRLRPDPICCLFLYPLNSLHWFNCMPSADSVRGSMRHGSESPNSNAGISLCLCPTVNGSYRLSQSHMLLLQIPSIHSVTFSIMFILCESMALHAV